LFHAIEYYFILLIKIVAMARLISSHIRDIRCPSSPCSSYGIPRLCLQGNSLAWTHYDS